jgi:hypothetical protein
MKTFKVNNQTSVVCESKNTRYGFKHEATLIIDGWTKDKAKCCYYNRTWESFEFESVIKNLLAGTKLLSKGQKTRFLNKISGKSHKETESQFKTLGMIMKMGDILCDGQKEKNDWKERMLKAGMENKGLIMPDDWPSLSEDDKQQRLNAVANNFTEKLL